MSVPFDLYEHPRVKAALEQADRLIWTWHDSQPEQHRPEGLSPWLAYWPGVALRESIARALLEASGWDFDIAEALIERKPFAMPAGDVFVEIDRLLALPEAERVAEWERIA